MKKPSLANRSMILSVNSLIGLVKAPQPLNFRLMTDDDASMRNTTSASGRRHVELDDVVLVDVVDELELLVGVVDDVVVVVVVFVAVVVVVDVVVKVVVVVPVVVVVMVVVVVVVVVVDGQTSRPAITRAKPSGPPTSTTKPRWRAEGETIGSTSFDTMFARVLMVELHPTSYAHRDTCGNA